MNKPSTELLWQRQDQNPGLTAKKKERRNGETTECVRRILHNDGDAYVGPPKTCHLTTTAHTGARQIKTPFPCKTVIRDLVLLQI